MLFAAVNVARKLRVDPELALRAATERFRSRVEGAAELALTMELRSMMSSSMVLVPSSS